jgi:hypothetical protein
LFEEVAMMAKGENVPVLTDPQVSPKIPEASAEGFGKEDCKAIYKVIK